MLQVSDMFIHCLNKKNVVVIIIGKIPAVSNPAYLVNDPSSFSSCRVVLDGWPPCRLIISTTG